MDDIAVGAGVVAGGLFGLCLLGWVKMFVVSWLWGYSFDEQWAMVAPFVPWVIGAAALAILVAGVAGIVAYLQSKH